MNVMEDKQQIKEHILEGAERFVNVEDYIKHSQKTLHFYGIQTNILVIIVNKLKNRIPMKHIHEIDKIFNEKIHLTIEL